MTTLLSRLTEGLHVHRVHNRRATRPPSTMQFSRRRSTSLELSWSSPDTRYLQRGFLDKGASPLFEVMHKGLLSSIAMQTIRVAMCLCPEIRVAMACSWHMPWLPSVRKIFSGLGCDWSVKRMLPETELFDLRNALWKLKLTMKFMADIAIEVRLIPCTLSRQTSTQSGSAPSATCCDVKSPLCIAQACCSWPCSEAAKCTSAP